VVRLPDQISTLTTELLASAGDRLAQLAMLLVDRFLERSRQAYPQNTSRTEEWHVPDASRSSRDPTQHLPLLVRKILRSVRVPLVAHLGHRAIQLGLRQTENNALDVPVDEVVVVVLLEDPCFLSDRGYGFASGP
jgi:hypothetical protein